MSNQKNTEDTTYNSDITKEDLKNLGLDQPNLRNDGGSDEMLKDRKRNVDFAGKDLDVPGRHLSQPELRKKDTLKDEENTLYAQGGERKNNLERDDSARNKE